MTNNLVTQLCL